ncbi:MAG TPA: peptide chain release factor N(5)-glutamine methyltransferase [Edaphobacter sp.]
MNLRQSLTAATQQLATDEHLRAEAPRDAELLLLHILHISRATLLAHPDDDLTSDQLYLYEQCIHRRLQHEPIQYITGQQEFYGLTLRVTPAVLIPRPETEHLVESVLSRLPQGKLKEHPVSIADVGTGSGAIAIALAVHLPEAHITALDLSTEALHIAQLNAENHNVAHRIRFLQSDLFSALPPGASFDAIVSNPPYVPTSDSSTLHPQVREHEPASALFAGPNGLEIYRRLIPEAHRLLKHDGLLALEIGHGQRDSLAELLADWHDLTFIDDLQQIPRVALARRSPATAS